MPRALAAIGTDLWAEKSFRALTRDQQRAYLLAYTRPDLNRCGVAPFHYGRYAALAADDSPTRMRTVLHQLEQTRHLVLDDDTGELLVRTYVRHDGLLAKPNLVIAMVNDYRAIVSVKIRRAFLTELRRLADVALSEQEQAGLRAVLGDPSTDAQRKAIPDGLVEPFTELFAEGFAEPFPEWFFEGFSERFPEGFGERLSRAYDAGAARACRRVAPAPAPAPAPPPASTGEPFTGDGPAIEAGDLEEEKINGHTCRLTALAVREARATARLPLGGWTERAIHRAVGDVLADPNVNERDVWRAMLELATDPSTERPGRLAHQVDDVLKRIRERDASAARAAAERRNAEHWRRELSGPKNPRPEVRGAAGGDTVGSRR